MAYTEEVKPSMLCDHHHILFLNSG